MLTRYEIARLVGLRALQLEQGAEPGMRVDDARLASDPIYVAARELEARTLDAYVQRPHGDSVDVRTTRLPPALRALLDTKDGGTRSHSSDSSDDSRMLAA